MCFRFVNLLTEREQTRMYARPVHRLAEMVGTLFFEQGLKVGRNPYFMFTLFVGNYLALLTRGTKIYNMTGFNV